MITTQSSSWPNQRMTLLQAVLPGTYYLISRSQSHSTSASGSRRARWSPWYFDRGSSVTPSDDAFSGPIALTARRVARAVDERLQTFYGELCFHWLREPPCTMFRSMHGWPIDATPYTTSSYVTSDRNYILQRETNEKLCSNGDKLCCGNRKENNLKFTKISLHKLRINGGPFSFLFFFLLW